MSATIAWLKSHKVYVIGGVLGIALVYYILKHASAASASSGNANDLSGGGNAVMALTSAASLQNAQINGSVEVAQLQAGVASRGIDAQLQSDLALTAAELAATQQKTSADAAVALGGQAASVEIQRIQSEQQVQQTQIVGETIDTLGAQHAAVQSQMISTVAAQVKQIQDHSKHASQDYTAIAPILAIETGNTGAAAATAAANAADRTAASNTKTAAVIGATSVMKDLVAGLFG